jgi:hypothetical protein
MEHGSQNTNAPDYKREEKLREAYERADGNVCQTAEQFEAARQTVSDWLQRYGIHETVPKEETSLAAQLQASDPDDVIGLEASTVTDARSDGERGRSL